MLIAYYQRNWTGGKSYPFILDDYADAVYYWLQNDLQWTPNDAPFVDTLLMDFCQIFYRQRSEQCEMLIDKLAKNPDIDEYYRKLIEGQIRASQAYDARGGEFADQVSTDRWQLFQQRAHEAIGAYERAGN